MDFWVVTDATKNGFGPWYYWVVGQVVTGYEEIRNRKEVKKKKIVNVGIRITKLNIRCNISFK